MLVSRYSTSISITTVHHSIPYIVLSGWSADLDSAWKSIHKNIVRSVDISVMWNDHLGTDYHAPKALQGTPIENSSV